MLELCIPSRPTRYRHPSLYSRSKFLNLYTATSVSDDWPRESEACEFSRGYLAMAMLVGGLSGGPNRAELGPVRALCNTGSVGHRLVWMKRSLLTLIVSYSPKQAGKLRGDSNESLATANVLVLACLLEKGAERIRRIGNANLPLTHRSNADESTTRGQRSWHYPV